MSNNQKKGLSSAIDIIQAGLTSADLATALRPQMAKVHWETVVGPQVAGATQVLAVRGGNTLVVRTKNSVWANELTLLKTDIISRLNRAIGGGKALADIRFEIGTLDPKRPPPVEPVTPDEGEIEAIALTQEDNLRIAKSSGGISDDTLRALVQRSLIRAAQADAWKRSQGWVRCAGCGTLTDPPSPGVDPSDALCPVCKLNQGRAGQM